MDAEDIRWILPILKRMFKGAILYDHVLHKVSVK